MYEIERDASGRIPDAPLSEIRLRIDRRRLEAAVYRAHETGRSLLLPHQYRRQLEDANRMRARLTLDNSDALYCDADERDFVGFWCAAPSQRLNGTQQLALSLYRAGRYASATLVPDILNLDNGLPWSLIRHLQATDDHAAASEQVRRTFERLCEIGHEVCREITGAGTDLVADDRPAIASTELVGAARQTLGAG